jgi:hypothetical protein
MISFSKLLRALAIQGATGAIGVLALLSLASAAQAQKPDATTATKPDSASDTASAPFGFADFTWLNGNSRQHVSVLDSKAFTGEFRADINYIGDFNKPQDHTLVGTSNAGRTGEIQVQQLGIGGDFHYGNARGRIMTQFGLYSTMTPRGDASPARGQWQLADAYRYISEAYGGYHLNKLSGINIDAGLFTSFLGAFSYYNYDNWAYQASYAASNTPISFSGVRVQIFVNDKLKIEPWLVNGWQAYGMFNGAPGAGLQVLWRPSGAISINTNEYYGHDWLGIPDRMRIHSDNTVQLKYLDQPKRSMDRGALSVTFDIGCESGGGVACTGSRAGSPAQNYLALMAYNRLWFSGDHVALTLGGGTMNNPGRYLVTLPPINGATAFSGTPYFTENPGDKFHAWDASATLDIMPDEFTTLRIELDHRAANVPYFAGSGGVTPPGGNSAVAGQLIPGWAPDLRRTESRLNLALLIKM